MRCMCAIAPNPASPTREGAGRSHPPPRSKHWRGLQARFVSHPTNPPTQGRQGTGRGVICTPIASHVMPELRHSPPPVVVMDSKSNRHCGDAGPYLLDDPEPEHWRAFQGICSRPTALPTAWQAGYLTHYPRPPTRVARWATTGCHLLALTIACTHSRYWSGCGARFWRPRCR
jgi:hypothetical protein